MSPAPSIFPGRPEGRPYTLADFVDATNKHNERLRAAAEPQGLLVRDLEPPQTFLASAPLPATILLRSGFGAFNIPSSGRTRAVPLSFLQTIVTVEDRLAAARGMLLHLEEAIQEMHEVHGGLLDLIGDLTNAFPEEAAR